MQPQQEPVMPGDAAAQRFAKRLGRRFDPAMGQLGQPLGIAFAGNQALDHCPTAEAHDVRDDRVELDVGVLQRLLPPWDMAAALAHQLLAGAQQIAHLLGLLVRYKTAPDQAVRQKVGQPGGVVHIGLGRPGTFLTCAAFASTKTKSPSLRISHPVSKRTPSPSFARWVQRCSGSQSDRASKSLVVVLKVRTSRSTEPVAMWRTQATTVSLCTSRPAQCGYRTSIVPPPHRRRGIPVEGNLELVLAAVASLRHNLECSKDPGSD